MSGPSPLVRSALLFALWHHQGGSSAVGQPIRAMLGIGQHARMTDDEVTAARRVQSALIVRPPHLVPTVLRFDQPISAEPIAGDQPVDLSNVIGADGRVVLIDDKAQPVACPLDLQDSACVCAIRVCTKCRAEDAYDDLKAQPPVEQVRPSDDDLWDQTLRERDDYHDWADRLAGAIAAHLGVEIGDHSNLNNPWQQAIEAIEPPKADQPPKRPENCGTSFCSCIECPFAPLAGRPTPTYHHAPTDDTEGGAA